MYESVITVGELERIILPPNSLVPEQWSSLNCRLVALAVKDVFQDLFGIFEKYNRSSNFCWGRHFMERELASREEKSVMTLTQFCKVGLTILRDHLFRLAHALGRRFVARVSYCIRYTEEGIMAFEGTALI